MKFSKLDAGIIDSTLWMQPHDVLRVWIAMLAKTDATGYVRASVPAMAHICMVPIERLEQILAILTSPDPYSRTPDDEGRRLRAVEGGWEIVNYGVYRASRDENDRRAQNREAQRRHRSLKKQDVAECQHVSATVSHGQPTSAISQQCQPRKPKSAQAEAEAEAEAIKAKTVARTAGTVQAALKLLPGVDPDVMRDWLAVRKAKRLPLTETAAKGVQREANKAGLALDDAVRMCVERGWASFKAGWEGVKAETLEAAGNARDGPEMLADDWRTDGFKSRDEALEHWKTMARAI